MAEIEKIIGNNPELFYNNEPQPGHRDRFASRLSLNRKKKTRRFSIATSSKIAAAMVILISVSYLMLNKNHFHNNQEVFITQIVLSDELKAEQKILEEQSMTRFAEIDEKAKDENEAMKMKEIARKKMEQLDANLAIIEKEYMKNPQSDQLKNAILANKKMKSQVVDNIINQMDNARRGYHAGDEYPKF